MSGLHDMVRDALAEPGLDPDVRALAVEALEAKLLARVRAVLGGEADASVTLRDDGSVRVAWLDSRGAAEIELPGGASDGVEVSTHKAVVESVQRELITQLAPSLGAARLAVKSGVSVTGPRAQEPTGAAKPARVEALHPTEIAGVLRALAELAGLQQQRLDELARALDEAGVPLRDERPERDARIRELRVLVDGLLKF